MTRCSLCPRVRKPVPSDGPSPCRVLFLAEAPSYREDQQLCPLVGKTGVEFNQTYLPILGLPRSSVHITNARLCSELDYANPTPAQALSCSSVHLGPLLAQVQPQVLVPMGQVACSLFPEIDLNLHHGIPMPGKWGSNKFVLFPMFHPSAGLHATGYMIPLTQDFEGLRRLLEELDRGTFRYPSDPFTNPDYRICQSVGDVAEYLGYGPPKTLACDTESLPDGSPFCVTFSHTPGTGRLIYIHDDGPFEYFQSWLDDGPDQLLFHNYLHDVTIFDRLHLPIRKFTDTMVRAYHLCLGGGIDDEDSESRAGRGSLGLKVLAYRHLAMHMTSFQDTVWPHSKPKLLDWLWDAERALTPSPKVVRCECGHTQDRHEPRGKTGRRLGKCSACGCAKWKKGPVVKATAEDKSLGQLHKKVSNLICGVMDGSKDNPWKQVRDWPDANRETLEEVLGPMPVPSIADVPEDVLLTYATRDADATLRLFLFLRRYKPWVFYKR